MNRQYVNTLLAIIPIPIPILLLCATTANASREYDIGFAAGINGNAKVCDRLPTSNNSEIDKHNDCYNGMTAGLDIYDKGTTPYKIGYRQGQNDSRAGLNDIAFCERQFINSSQSDQCDEGYTAGNAHGHISALALAAIKQTSAYRLGWNAGIKYSVIVRINDTAIYNDPCNSYNANSRNLPICEMGYTDGQNKIPFDKLKTYRYGYYYGKMGAEGKTSGDRAGDCEFDPYIPLKQKICEDGWDTGWDSVKHKHIDQ
ncbi:MAG: hypothetical protein WAM14_26300 [Candidatus Nitrosopolaris sp.]